MYRMLTDIHTFMLSVSYYNIFLKDQPCRWNTPNQRQQCPRAQMVSLQILLLWNCKTEHVVISQLIFRSALTQQAGGDLDRGTVNRLHNGTVQIKQNRRQGLVSWPLTHSVICRECWRGFFFLAPPHFKAFAVRLRSGKCWGFCHVLILSCQSLDPPSDLSAILPLCFCTTCSACKSRQVKALPNGEVNI